MPTYLALINKLALESKVTSSASAVAAVTSQVGMAARFVKWIADAHRDIQGSHDNWRWMRSGFTVQTVAGDGIYAGTDCTDTLASAAVTRFGRWITHDNEGRSNVTCYLTSAGVPGERTLIWLPWSRFRFLYRRATQNNNPPIHFSVDPQDNLVIGPKPEAVYTVNGEYQRSALVLANAGDTPEFHSDFHDLVVWYALDKYGRTAIAPEIVGRAQMESSRLMRQLESSQLPTDFDLGPPLA